ncbi:MAG: decaprenyl-phosphate phosphoribosyltransferase [Chloroflexota bacterium]
MSSTTVVSSSSFMTTLRGLLKTMRPQQWTKNAVVYAGLVFDGKLLSWSLFWQTTVVALCCCFAASSVYLLNDLVDIENDRKHPKKRLRALPSGQLSPLVAAWASLLLALTSVLVSGWLNVWVGIVLLAYLIQNIAYCFYLKRLVIIDGMVVALGFLLRVVAGVLIAHVANFSPWLYVCVTLVALLLVFGKRRHEITLLADGAAQHRSSLAQYNLPLLDQILSIVTTITLVAYTFYTFEAETALAKNGQMLLTTPFIYYFMFRYLYLVHVEKRGGAPDELLLEDKHLLVTAILWMASVVILIYGADLVSL